MLSVHTRPVLPEDRQGLVLFFKEVMDWPGFEHTGSVADYWDWKYIRKPGRGSVGYAAWSGEKAVSHASASPVSLLIDRKAVGGGQLGDLYTRPEYRGNGLAERMMERVEERAAADGIELLYAFPSEIGYRLVTKRGFWEAPLKFSQYQLITNPSMFFDQVSLGPLKKAAYRAMLALRSPARRSVPGMVKEVSLFPADIDQMTERFEANFDLTLRHDRDYLDWRYTDPDGGRFRTLVATVDGQTAGCAIVRLYSDDGPRYMDIVDLMADLDRPAVAQSLVAEAVRIAMVENIDGVQTWIPSDHPLVPFLVRAGFIVRTPLVIERKLRLLCKAVGGNDPALDDLRRPGLRAHIMLGDTDWI